MRFPCRVSATSSRGMLSIRPCVVQNQNEVGNFNTSLAFNGFCNNLSSLCVFFCPVEIQICTGASPTHKFSSVLALVIGCCYQIRACCIAMTELDTMLHVPVLCFKLNSNWCAHSHAFYTTGFSGCLPDIARLKLSASHGPSCLCLYINTLAYEDIVSRIMWQDLK